MIVFKNRKVYFVSGLVIMLGLCGCSPERAEVQEPVVVNVEVELSEDALEKLAMADAHDGTVDHVVEDCAACKLHMKGKEEYAATINGYTFHLCSARCKKSMANDPEQVLDLLEMDE